jgi:rhomboid protease GluP
VASAVVHPATVSVGASGSIFGLFGILLTLLALRDERIAQMRSFILVNVLIFVGLNLLLGSISTGIDNAAHLGGLATGILLGLIIRFAIRSASPVHRTAKPHSQGATQRNV